MLCYAMRDTPKSALFHQGQMVFFPSCLLLQNVAFCHACIYLSTSLPSGAQSNMDAIRRRRRKKKKKGKTICS